MFKTELDWVTAYKNVENQLEEKDNRIAELEKENAEAKCECRRCVYTDSPCVLSDYGKDRNGICDHFKNVFDENAELKADNDARKFAMAMSEKVEKQLREENAELKSDNTEWERASDKWKSVYEITNNQLTKAKELLERLLITSCNSDVLNLLPNCSEVLRVRVEAEQFLKE